MIVSWNIIKPLNVLTGEKKMDAPPEMSVGIIIGSVLAVILCMAIATGMIVILIKRWVLGRDTSHRTRLRYLRFINEAHVDIFCTWKSM